MHDLDKHGKTDNEIAEAAFSRIAATIPANCTREEWIKIAGAYKTHGGSWTRFDDWSQTDEKYNTSDCVRMWNSMKPSTDPAGALGYLVKLAGGWKAIFPDESPVRPRPPRIAPPPPQTAAADRRQAAAVGKVVAVYEYRDRNGRLMALNLRYNPKDFRPRYAIVENPDPKEYDNPGQWARKKPAGFEVPLYHEDQIVNRPGETVYFLEGEKDADNLAKLGYLTSCHKAGGTAIKSGRGLLAGRQCVIIQDADEPGREYAAKAKQAIYAECARVSVIAPPEGFKDYSEWEEAQDSAESLEELKARFNAWGSKLSELEPEEDAAPAGPVKMTLLEIREKIRREGEADPNELIKNRFLCRGGAGLLSAETGVGKSSFIMQLALHWAIGKSCFGMEPARPLKILIIQAENDERDINEECTGICNGAGCNESWSYDSDQRATGSVSIISDAFYSGDEFIRFLGQELQQDAEMETMPDLVIIDPLLAFAGCDLSDQGKVSRFLRNGINPLIKQHNVAALFVHHMTKPVKTAMPNTNFNKAYSYHGSGDIINWARCSLVLERFRDKDGNSFCVLTAEKRGRRLGWDRDKKYLRWSDEYIYWEELKTPPEMEQPAVFTAEDRAEQREQRKKDELTELARQAAELLKSGESVTATEFIGRIMGHLRIRSKDKAYTVSRVCIADSLVIEREPKAEEKTSPAVKRIIERPAEPPEEQDLI